MEEVENMTQDDVLDVIKDFPVKPLGRKVIITLNVEEPDGELILAENSFSETQFVVAKGERSSKQIKAGSKVLLDVERMMEYLPNPENSYEKIGRIKVKPVEANGRLYGMISEDVIDALDNR